MGTRWVSVLDPRTGREISREEFEGKKPSTVPAVAEERIWKVKTVFVSNREQKVYLDDLERKIGMEPTKDHRLVRKAIEELVERGMNIVPDRIDGGYMLTDDPLRLEIEASYLERQAATLLEKAREYRSRRAPQPELFR